MSKRWIVPAAVPAVLLSMASAVEAQRVTSPYEFLDTRHGVHAYASYVITDRGVIDVGPGSGRAVAIGYAGRIAGPFGVDTRVGFLRTSRRVYDLAEEQPDPSEIQADPRAGLVQVATADMSLVQGDVSLRFDITGPRTWYRLQPYALIGVGAVVVAGDDRGAETDADIPSERLVRFRSGLTGHVGGGIEWHLTERVTVRFDARDVLWRVHVPAGFRTGARLIEEREWVQTGHLGVGLGFRF